MSLQGGREGGGEKRRGGRERGERSFFISLASSSFNILTINLQPHDPQSVSETVSPDCLLTWPLRSVTKDLSSISELFIRLILGLRVLYSFALIKIKCLYHLSASINVSLALAKLIWLWFLHSFILLTRYLNYRIAHESPSFFLLLW